MPNRNRNEHVVVDHVEFEEPTANYADGQSDYNDMELSESQRLLDQFLADGRERNQDAAIVLDNPTDRGITDDQRISAIDVIGETANRFQGSSYTNEEAGISDRKSVIVNVVNHMTADWHQGIESEQYWQAPSYDTPPPACDEALADLDAEMADALAAGDSHLANENLAGDRATGVPVPDRPTYRPVHHARSTAGTDRRRRIRQRFQRRNGVPHRRLGMAGGATLGLRQRRAAQHRRKDDESVRAGYEVAVA